MIQRIADLKAAHTEFTFLMRSDEERGYFVHLHSGPIRDTTGGLLGFQHSFRAWGADLEATWDDALAQLKKEMVQ